MSKRKKPVPFVRPPAEPIATRYLVHLHVEPLDGHGVVADIKDPRLTPDAFLSVEALTAALTEALAAAVQLYAQHAPRPTLTDVVRPADIARLN